MIKSAHSILGLTLGFWKRPFSQAQHSSLQSDATLPPKMQSEERVFSNSPSKYPAQLACSALFLPLHQLDGYYHRIQRRASWGIICSEQRAKVRERVLLRSACCIVPRSLVLLPSYFLYYSFSSFYPPFTLTLLFLSLSLSLSLFYSISL